MYAIVQYEDLENNHRNFIAVFLYDTQQKAEIEVAYYEKRPSRFKYHFAPVVRSFKDIPVATPYALICTDSGYEEFTVYLSRSKENASKEQKLYNENCHSYHSIVPVFDTRKSINGEKLSKTEVVE